MISVRLHAPVAAEPTGGGGSRLGHGLTITSGRVDDGDRTTSSGVVDIDLTGHVILPGLVNAHDHLQLNAASGLVPPRCFDNASQWIEWLGERLRDDDEAPGLRAPKHLRLWQGGLKNVLSGVTTVAHHDHHHEVFGNPGFPVRVVPCGWAHSPYLAGTYGPSLESSWRRTPPDLPWIIHLAEGTDAPAAAELDTLQRAGCLGPRTVAVHAVGLDDQGRRRLLAAGAAAVWCPTSNLRILGSTLDPRQWPDGRLAIGTDSRLTGARDLLDELRAASAASGRGAAALVRHVTVDAARILRLDHAGSLDPGAPADLVVLRLHGDPWRSLLEADRADLRAVALGGRPVIAGPDLSPWFEAAGVRPAVARLDGREKLVDPERLGPIAAAGLEPGLEVDS
jgi:cytosine/adenosine deaminase-related metal-dependent hydrolase